MTAVEMRLEQFALCHLSLCLARSLSTWVNRVPAEMSHDTKQYHLHYVTVWQSVRPMFAHCEVPVRILFIFRRHVLRLMATYSCGSWVRRQTTPQSTHQDFCKCLYVLHVVMEVKSYAQFFGTFFLVHSLWKNFRHPRKFPPKPKNPTEFPPYTSSVIDWAGKGRYGSFR